MFKCFRVMVQEVQKAKKAYAWHVGMHKMLG